MRLHFKFRGSQSHFTDLLHEVSHWKGRDSASRRLRSAAFPGNTFICNCVGVDFILGGELSCAQRWPQGSEDISMTVRKSGGMAAGHARSPAAPTCMYRDEQGIVFFVVAGSHCTGTDLQISGLTKLRAGVCC